MRFLNLLSGILLLLVSNSTFAHKTSSCTAFSPITFGILPFVSAEQLVLRFSPLANYLARQMLAEVRIETASNLGVFFRRTTEDARYDILFTAPHFFPSARHVGYQLIASVDSPGMRAIIVVPAKSNITSVNDLRGKRMATADRKSLVSILVKKHLLKYSLNIEKDIEIVYTPTHNASLLSTYHGVTDASALMQPPYEASSQQIKNNMRIISKTDYAPHIPISVGERINKACKAEISQLLLSMHMSADGQRVLKYNRFLRFRGAKIEEYNEFDKQIMRE